MTVNVDMKALLEAGAHFGHKTSRWHPKMAPYIHSKRQDAHIINLEKTVEGLEVALPKITDIVKNGKKVLFVGTKKQMKDAVEIDGVDLIGYTPWGCIDLVSASTGEMRKRYGFIYVDKHDDGTGTMKRSKKDSFYWYKKCIESQGTDLD